LPAQGSVVVVVGFRRVVVVVVVVVVVAVVVDGSVVVVVTTGEAGARCTGGELVSGLGVVELVVVAVDDWDEKYSRMLLAVSFPSAWS
jgi:hypothetical protein